MLNPFSSFYSGLQSTSSIQSFIWRQDMKTEYFMCVCLVKRNVYVPWLSTFNPHSCIVQKLFVKSIFQPLYRNSIHNFNSELYIKAEYEGKIWRQTLRAKKKTEYFMSVCFLERMCVCHGFPLLIHIAIEYRYSAVIYCRPIWSSQEYGRNIS